MAEAVKKQPWDSSIQAMAALPDGALYKMWAIDGGLKKSGFSVNGQYYFRWLSDFEADGPLPLASTFDHGFELSTGKFIDPKKLLLYVRGSKVFGQFANPYEYGGGFKWYLLPTERLWMTGEVMRVNKSPYGGALYSLHRGIGRLGADASDGPRFLTSRTWKNGDRREVASSHRVDFEVAPLRSSNTASTIV